MATTDEPKLALTLFAAIFLFFSIAVLPSDAVSSPDDTPTLAELLPKFGLPSGLFPESVVNFTFTVSHSLVIQLEKPCYVHVGGTIYYDRVIGCDLSYGSLTFLQGIEVYQFLWIWNKVNEIKLDSGAPDSIFFRLNDFNFLEYDIHEFKIRHACQDSLMASRFRPFKGAAHQVPAVEAAHSSNETQMLAAE